MQGHQRNCVVCSKENSIYKCPRCGKYYCSVECCNRHKSDTSDVCTSDDSSTALSGGKIEDHSDGRIFEAEDTVSRSKLELLQLNDDLKSLLKSSSHLQRLLLAIDRSSNPSVLLDQAMKTDGDFQRFASLCLKTVSDEYPREDDPTETQLAVALCSVSCSEIPEGEGTSIDDFTSLFHGQVDTDGESSLFA